MVGQTIGKYRIIDRLGRGGMGTVYRAIDETLHREVAIKVLNTELNDPGVGRRFRAEAVAIARLNHPGIATIYELMQHEGQWLMVIEFVRGETLEAMIAREGPIAPERAAAIVVQVLSALAHAHGMGVVHRDLKPANIMSTTSGATKIMDFGIARVSGTEHLTSAGFMMGTPAYMAPEQVLGGEIDSRTDLYAIGVVLYFLVTATLPFKGDTPMAMAESRIKDLPTPVRAIRPDLPAWFGLVMDRALTRALEHRFQTADEFCEALRRGIAGLPIETAPSLQVPPELVATALPGTMAVLTSAGSGSASGAVPAPPMPAAPAAASGAVAKPATVSNAASQATLPGTLPPDLRPTMLAGTGAAPSVASPDATAAQVPGAISPKKAAAPALNRTGLIAIGAAVLVLAVVAAFMFRRAPSTPPPPAPAEQTGTPTPAPVPAPRESPATPAPQGGTPSAPPVTPPSGADDGRARGTVSVPPAPPPVVPVPPVGTSTPPVPTPTAPGTPSTAAPKSGGREGKGAPAADPVIRYDRLKQLLVKGRSGEERDVLLFFGNGAMSLVAMNDQGAGAVPYKDLVAATYVRAKDPKWDTTLPGPPTNLDVPGGMFRAARHWLVIQTKGSYAILRLEDSNWASIVGAIEARTGIKVARPAH
jgi:eukaryotic-like serine/threonine-protein kinase